jgi:hypothetical protein
MMMVVVAPAGSSTNIIIIIIAERLWRRGRRNGIGAISTVVVAGHASDDNIYALLWPASVCIYYIHEYVNKTSTISFTSSRSKPGSYSCGVRQETKVN